MRNNFVRAAGAALAVAVGITSAVAISGPAAADPPTRVGGTVVAASDGTTPLAGITVNAYLTSSGALAASAITGADGKYNMLRPGAGLYTIRFDDPSGTYVTEWYNNQASIETAEQVDFADGHKATLGLTDLATTVVTPTPEPTPTDNPTPTPTPTTTTTTPAATAPTAVSLAPTTTTASAVTVAVRPRIRGVARVTKVLKVTKGTWTPNTVSRKIQWLANGKRIKGATKARLRLTKKLAGKRISVRVVASAPNLAPLKVTTKRTKKVRR